MMVDMESARALQIFKTERHPSAQLQIGNSKEGLSVYALLNNCRTAMGKRLLRSWLLLPIQDSDMLLERQKAVQFFVNPENEHAASSLSDFLKKVKDLPGIVGRMQRYRETPTDWMSLFKVHIPLIHASTLLTNTRARCTRSQYWTIAALWRFTWMCVTSRHAITH